MFRRLRTLSTPSYTLSVSSPSPFLSTVVAMLARRSLARLAAQQPALGAAPSGARNMATLRELELRLKSVRNIEKITKVCLCYTPVVAYLESRNLRMRGDFLWCIRASIVHEDDCVHEVGQGPACHAERQGVWCCQQRCVSYAICTRKFNLTIHHHPP